MEKCTADLDIFPSEIFFVHDFTCDDYTVKHDRDSAYDGFFIETKGIEAATMTVYSADSKVYKAKVKKYVLSPRADNNGGIFRATVEYVEDKDEEAVRDSLKRLNAMKPDDVRALGLELVNAIDDDSKNDESFKELYMKAADPEAVKGFVLKVEREFTAALGNGEEVIDFIHRTTKAPNPWTLMAELENNCVGAS